jgi:hypothetical protein
MAIIQSIIGSSYQFATSGSNPITIPGAEASISNIQPGLLRKVYTGYFSDAVDWFDTATMTSITQDTFVNLNGFASVYSVQWTGYFLVPTTGTYTFQTNSDDASYVWLGNNAKTGYTTSNAVVNNGGAHGMSPASSSQIIMNAGDYYPIRIQYGDGGGNDGFNISYDINGAGFNYIAGQDVWISGSTVEGFN